MSVTLHSRLVIKRIVINDYSLMTSYVIQFLLKILLLLVKMFVWYNNIVLCRIQSGFIVDKLENSHR